MGDNITILTYCLSQVVILESLVDSSELLKICAEVQMFWSFHFYNKICVSKELRLAVNVSMMILKTV